MDNKGGNLPSNSITCPMLGICCNGSMWNIALHMLLRAMLARWLRLEAVAWWEGLLGRLGAYSYKKCKPLRLCRGERPWTLEDQGGQHHEDHAYIWIILLQISPPSSKSSFELAGLFKSLGLLMHIFIGPIGLCWCSWASWDAYGWSCGRSMEMGLLLGWHDFAALCLEHALVQKRVAEFVHDYAFLICPCLGLRHEVCWMGHVGLDMWDACLAKRSKSCMLQNTCFASCNDTW